MLERNVRRTAASRGLDEAVTWSFISQEEADVFGPGEWKLANPISEDMKVMRPSLLPGLISAAGPDMEKTLAGVVEASPGPVLVQAIGWHEVEPLVKQAKWLHAFSPNVPHQISHHRRGRRHPNSFRRGYRPQTQPQGRRAQND